MRFLLIFLGIVTLIAFLEPLFEDVKNSATLFGSLAGTVTLAVGIAWSNMNEKARLILAVLILAGYAVVLILMSIIYVGGKDSSKNEKAIIALGCKVKGDLPCLSLVKRVDATYDFLTKNPDSIAILSGGQGRDENISEAECMKNMLLEKGIAENRLFIDDKSTSTDENIRFSMAILDELGLGKNVAIATSEYHELRAKMIAKRYELVASAKSSKTKPVILPTFLLREIFAIAKEIIIK